MGAVYVKCPVTNVPIATGIDMDEETLKSLTPFVGRVACPHCKTTHEWTKIQAWIALEDGFSR